MHKFIILLGISAAFIAAASGNVDAFAENDANDMVITPEEENALVMFKLMVMDSLSEEFMKTDFYLVRWIRLARFNLERAQKLLMETVEWRNVNFIRDIMSEDWSDLEKTYPIVFDGRDKQGRPIACIDLGEWDLRAAVNQGKQQRLVRYLAYSLERGMQEVFLVQQENNGTSSPHVSRGLTLVDIQNMGFRSHLCGSCLSILTQWVSTMEAHYPKFLKEIVIINAPGISQIAINVLRPFMSSETKETMKVFNNYRKTWMDYLDERVERDQRNERYGGTRWL